MKKIALFIILFLGLLGLNAQTLVQNMFIDFGTSAALTSGPDANGNYWNNITNPAASTTSVALINSVNSTTGYSHFMTKSLQAFAGASFGGLMLPSASLLGEFAIASATQDYFSNNVTGSMKFTGLNVNRAYKFKIFGSRSTTETRISQYALEGLNTSTGKLQVGGANLGGTGYNGNNSSIYTSEFVFPNASGEILLTISLVQGSMSNIAAMKIEEYADVPIVNPSGITVAGQSVPGAIGSYQMTATVTPSNATYKNVSWSVDNTDIATIDATGLLKAKANGTVTVTATTVDPNSTVSGSTSMDVEILGVTGITVSGTTNNNSTFQMTATVLPANATFKDVTWSVDDINIASINASGLLIAKANGTVTVTATTKQPGSTICGSYQVTTKIDDSLLDKLKIAVMGSSVPYGVGATSFQGYVYQYTKLLGQRYTNETGANWTVSNISIGGNSTVQVLGRWDSDLIPQYSKYVVYALSLGNEGIHEYGQSSFNQFRTNMLLLIDKARQKGMIPVVTSNYTRADFNAVDYEFIKQMNLLIHEWDVPSVNLLGAIDDGAGRWASGYMNDAYHPNDAGHKEFSYAIVPSLFDALKSGKILPVKINGTYITLGKSVNQSQIEFTPENTIHPFTLSFDIKTTNIGTVASFKQGAAWGTLSINTSGMLRYLSPAGMSVVGQVAINDGEWHKITLTHYYARGLTILYSDNVAVGSISEKLVATTFYLSDQNAPNSINYRDLFFYRSGMNALEIAALNNGKLLKSSLEIYAPLDGQALIGSDPYINLAQSTNTLKINDLSTGMKSSTEFSACKIYPCPVNDILNIKGLNSDSKYEFTIYRIDGRVALSQINVNQEDIDVSALPSGQYVLVVRKLDTLSKISLDFTKR